MWKVIREPNDISMTRGDFGVQLPIKVNGVAFAASDSVKVTIKSINAVVIEKVYTDIANNTVDLELTESESALLPIGSYKYSLDWYQNGAFMCNIIPFAEFKVVDKV